MHAPWDGLVGGIYFFGKAHTIKFHQGAAIEFDPVLLTVSSHRELATRKKTRPSGESIAIRVGTVGSIANTGFGFSFRFSVRWFWFSAD